jgi:hypothetical protein
MLYISPNNEYPRHIGDIKVANPDWEPEFGLPTGWTLVKPTDPPALIDGKVLQELFPQEIDGVWRQVWTLRDLTTEELEKISAPITARQKLKDIAGLTDLEIDALSRGLV